MENESTPSLVGAAYDSAQAEALRLRNACLARITAQLAAIQRESGSLDVVADYLDDIAREVKRAIQVNTDLQTNALDGYATDLITCGRCGRKHQRRHLCVCRG